MRFSKSRRKIFPVFWICHVIFYLGFRGVPRKMRNGNSLPLIWRFCVSVINDSTLFVSAGSERFCHVQDCPFLSQRSTALWGTSKINSFKFFVFLILTIIHIYTLYIFLKCGFIAKQKCEEINLHVFHILYLLIFFFLPAIWNFIRRLKNHSLIELKSELIFCFFNPWK